MYDAQIGRFTTMDPMAVFTPGISPYAYANDNPINEIDYYGLGIIDWFKKHVMGNHSMTYWKSRLKNTSFMKSVKGMFGLVDATGNLYRPSSRSHSGSSSSSGSSAPSNPTASNNNTPPDNERDDVILEPLQSRTAELSNGEPDLALRMPSSSQPPIPEYKNKPIKGGTTLPFAENIYYQSSSDRFLNAAYTEKTLSDLVKSLQEYPQLTVLILGNLDMTGAITGNGRAALNQPADLNGIRSTAGAVMNARAMAVYNYLVGKGISPERLIPGAGNVFDTPRGTGMKTTFVLKNP